MFKHLCGCVYMHMRFQMKMDLQGFVSQWMRVLELNWDSLKEQNPLLVTKPPV